MSDSDIERVHVPSDREYARPNQHWICGKSADGCSCPFGPSAKGKCRATFECIPARRGDSWRCTRSSIRGGNCGKGPLPDGTCCHPVTPCVPVRSWKSRRFEVSIAVFAFAVGIAAILLAFPLSSEVISPGPLTRQHAATANRCADCHTVDNSGLTRWVENAVHLSDVQASSQKCLACHKEIGPDALNPHSLPNATIDNLTQRASSREGDNSTFVTAAASALFGSAHLHGNLQCARCHHEHQGADHDLNRLSNQQCQICHASSFASFSHGHPDLDQYPFRRRTKIYFDHASHYGKHFAVTSVTGTIQKEIACNLCHVADPSGTVMELRGFEQTCFKCHSQQITEDLVPGFVIASIPSLDLEVMAQRGLNPGVWPESGNRHAAAKNKISPWMKLMLVSDPRFNEIWKRMDAFNLSDLRNVSDDGIAVVSEFAWLLKENLRKWSRGHQDNGNPFVDLIPTAQFKNLEEKWFPDLFTELGARQLDFGVEIAQKIELRNLPEIAQEQHRYERSINSGWYLQDSDMTLRYRPTGHADPVLRKIMDIAVRLENAEQQSGEGNASVIDTTFLDELFGSVSSPFSPGRCTKCHTIDRGSDGASINWTGKKASPSRKSFTHFKHGIHLTSLSNEECASCHVLVDSSNRSTIYNSEFINPQGQLAFDASDFKSDFCLIGKQNCIGCHNHQAAGDNCLDCHNYHIR